MKKAQGKSYLISITVHILLMFIFMFLNFEIVPDEEDFVTLGFGTFGKLSSPGSPSETNDNVRKEPEKKAPKEKLKQEIKKVEIPKVKNVDKNNVAIKDNKKNTKEADDNKNNESVKKEIEKSSDGESVGNDQGSFGFEIDFGGKGKRRIYSYHLPEYPEGVSKEIDVKLKFSILPDGTVSRITPLIKADTRLELAAINSLRKWRFEPLPQSQKQALQSAVIIFPYRLR